MASSYRVIVHYCFALRLVILRKVVNSLRPYGALCHNGEALMRPSTCCVLVVLSAKARDFGLLTPPNEFIDGLKIQLHAKSA